MERQHHDGKFDDILLLRLIKDNDKQAFKYLFERFFAPMCRFACIYISNRLVAEEIVLDIFISVWKNRNELELKVSWKAYLFRSVRNRVLNYIRDNERFVSVSTWSLYEEAETDNSFELKELERLIVEAIYTLPELCGEIFRKSRIEHHTNREIAHEFNISVKYVEAQITKALKLIKKYLGDSYYYFW